MTTTTTNGQARQTLASQLDRLDSILDGLSDALHGISAVSQRVAAEGRRQGTGPRAGPPGLACRAWRRTGRR